MPYIGQPLNAGNLSVDVFTGNGSTTVFALTYSVGSSESVAIYLDGVKQAVSTYTASGTVLTFTTAPPNLVGIEVVFLALAISLPTPGDGTVTAAKIADNAVGLAQLASGTDGELITWDASGNSAVVAVGTAGHVLTSGGVGVAPTFQTSGVVTLDSSVSVKSINGYGSTNTKIRRFTTIETNTGSDITYADSAANGGSFTINTAGVYAISFADEFSGSANMGISLNSSQLTTVIYSITAADQVCIGATHAANAWNNIGVTLILAATDVIRAHTDGTASGSNSARAFFTITRVG